MFNHVVNVYVMICDSCKTTKDMRVVIFLEALILRRRE